ncbi:MAG: hypothetical protein HFE68_04100 [Erysipelotrichaceae bacterium]|nr:hypothetical protein [Erysipelotrichaceae bacterium]
MYKKYLESINKTNDVIRKLDGSDEISRISKSEIKWALSKMGKKQRWLVKKGEIYQFDFGKNFVPEMSYEHRGVVIGVRKRLLYVLPIFSYKPNLHADAYHPISNNQSTSDFYLLKSDEFQFINHDSVIKLNDLRSISINRILYSHDARFDIHGDAFKSIEHMAIQKHFASFYREYEDLLKERDQLKEEIRKLQNDIKLQGPVKG